MRSEQLEAWVLSVVDQVLAGRRVEDSRVELKADWPDPKASARRIAGHANAAGSDSILWIIGLDEKRGITPVAPTDLADWLPQVVTEFDELAPSLRDLSVPTPSGPVVALLFDVSRRPFVIKNPVFGQKGGGAVALEVPWRRGTAVHSARRDELIRILVPRQVLPSVELLKATAEVTVHSPIDPAYQGDLIPVERSEHLAWSFYFTLYVTPRTADLLVLPAHKAVLSFAAGSEESRIAVRFRFYAPSRYTGSHGSVLDSETAMATDGEAVFRGPGLIHAQASHSEAVRSIPTNSDLAVILALSPAGSELRTETVIRLLPVGEQEGQKRRWEAQEQTTA